MSTIWPSDNKYLISDKNWFMSCPFVFQISNKKPLIIEKFGHRWLTTNDISRFRCWYTRIHKNITERIIWSIGPNVRGDIHQFGFFTIRRTSSDQSILSIIRKSTSVFMWIFGRFDPSILFAVKTRIRVSQLWFFLSYMWHILLSSSVEKSKQRRIPVENVLQERLRKLNERFSWRIILHASNLWT